MSDPAPEEPEGHRPPPPEAAPSPPPEAPHQRRASVALPRSLPSGDDSALGLGLRLLRKAVQTMQLGLTITDPTGRIFFVNDAAAQMWGGTTEEILGKDVGLFAPPGVRKPLKSDVLRTLRRWSRESTNCRKDGTQYPVHLLSDVLLDANGEPLAVVTVSSDITERKRLESEIQTAKDALEKEVEERTEELRSAVAALKIEVEERRASEERYRFLFERNLAAVYRMNRAGLVLSGNESFARLLGFQAPEDVLERGAGDFVPNDSEREALLLRLDEHGTLRNLERRFERADGREVWILENLSLVPEPGAPGGIIQGTAVDITERKHAEQRLQWDALHDVLTGLANRTLFQNRLEHALQRARRQKLLQAVLFVDIDRFKLINDGLGHAAGDNLLVEAGQRLQSAVRDEDTVARLGGDEFCILVEDAASAEEALAVADRVLKAFEPGFLVEGRTAYVGASIGIALGGLRDETPLSLLRDADTAMYRAKAAGRGRAVLFDEKMRQRALAVFALESDLRQALERDEFFVVYQPIVALETRRIAGFEALVRWMHPVRGLVSPVEFIPPVEDNGLIVQLGAHVLRTALQELRRFRELRPELTMSVNLSPRQLADRGLLAMVDEALVQAGLAGNALVLEVTESAVLENTDRAIRTLESLRVRGIAISLDDFGTGYSSLGHLRRLPLDKLKIDRSFLRRLEGVKEAEIVRVIVELAKRLSLSAIAEGIETEEHLDALRALGCPFGQGFLFAEPLKAEAARAMLLVPE